MGIGSKFFSVSLSFSLSHLWFDVFLFFLFLFVVCLLFLCLCLCLCLSSSLFSSFSLFPLFLLGSVNGIALYWKYKHYFFFLSSGILKMQQKNIHNTSALIFAVVFVIHSCIPGCDKKNADLYVNSNDLLYTCSLQLFCVCVFIYLVVFT